MLLRFAMVCCRSAVMLCCCGVDTGLIGVGILNIGWRRLLLDIVEPED